MKFYFGLMNLPIKYLKYLSGERYAYLELKCNTKTTKSKFVNAVIWVSIDIQNQEHITKLHLRSLDSSGAIEERYFEEGYLKYNEYEGIYIEKFNFAQYQLANLPVEDIPPSWSTELGYFLSVSI